MLHGIDISNHQGDNGIELENVLPYVDFCIVKATGGNFYVDPYCDGFIEKCKQQGKLWGFYHFANDGQYSSAYDEAKFFYDNCRNYFGEGIPILDWEVDDVTPAWVNEFANAIHDFSGVWPWIYGNAWRFDIGSIEQNCARWVAAYPSWIVNPYPGFDPGDCPDCDGLVAAWQYASDGKIPTYWGNLDMNVYYGDTSSWHAYATGDTEETPLPPEQDTNLTHVFDDEKYHVEITEKA